MARCDQRPEDRSSRACLAVGEDRLWKFDERLLELVDDLGLQDRVVFGWAMGVGETGCARKLLRLTRGQIYSLLFVRPDVQNRCEASRMKCFKNRRAKLAVRSRTPVSR